jgi:phosphoribosylformimino-5-aminoimidazole carboxamide ribotide isomerase
VRILPVLDLLGGQLVHAVAGRRAEYRPVRSILCGDAKPTSLAHALVDMGFRDAYVADLDAIGGAEPDWATLRSVSDCGLALWLDAGLSNRRGAEEVLHHAQGSDNIRTIIAGLESLPSLGLLPELLEVIGSKRLAFSLDLKQGQPITRVPEWQDKCAEDIAQLAYELGIRRLIVLDLSKVGRSQGTGTAALCRRLRSLAPWSELIAGGGVRNFNDLSLLAEAGCDAALVATALHHGHLTPVDLASVRTLGTT